MALRRTTAEQGTEFSKLAAKKVDSFWPEHHIISFGEGFLF